MWRLGDLYYTNDHSIVFKLLLNYISEVLEEVYAFTVYVNYAPNGQITEPSRRINELLTFIVSMQKLSAAVIKLHDENNTCKQHI